MSLSFTIRPRPNPLEPAQRRKVLITGAAGTIGAYLAAELAGQYDLRLMVRGDEPSVDSIKPHGQLIANDLADMDGLKRACAGIDTVLHLAATPDPSAVWASVLPNNIVGTYNLMAAAKSSGVRRVIFASSIHAVSGYPPDVQIKTNDPVNPGDLYGVSKCFGEALGRYMAEQEGMSVIALRIGAFLPVERMREENYIGSADMFLSPSDLLQMVQKCIADQTLTWAVFHVVSDNRFKRLDITDARELLGYQPKDDATRLLPQFKDLNLAERIQTASLRDRDQKSGLRDTTSGS
jgi:nucleoside-diphosphate-sugar epimerase